MLISSCAPSSVPRVSASMRRRPRTRGRAARRSPRLPAAPSGTTRPAPPGAETIEAISRCATASGSTLLQDARVEEQHGARDRRHAAGHDREQLAARHARELRPHEQRRLDHADEHVRRGGEADDAADAHRRARAARTWRAPPPAARASGTAAPRARSSPARSAARGRRGRSSRPGRDRERRRAAAQIAEHERRSRLRGFFEREHRVVQREERVLGERQLEEQQREDDLQHEARRRPRARGPRGASRSRSRRSRAGPRCRRVRGAAGSLEYLRPTGSGVRAWGGPSRSRRPRRAAAGSGRRPSRRAARAPP